MVKLREKTMLRCKKPTECPCGETIRAMPLAPQGYLPSK